MAKIKFSIWKSQLEIEEGAEYHRVQGVEFWVTNSRHGKSMGEAKCPCCGSITSIYIWSFAGSGKRCGGCNVLMGVRSALISKNEITQEQLSKFKN